MNLTLLDWKISEKVDTKGFDFPYNCDFEWRSRSSKLIIKM